MNAAQMTARIADGIAIYSSLMELELRHAGEDAQGFPALLHMRDNWKDWTNANLQLVQDVILYHNSIFNLADDIVHRM